MMITLMKKVSALSFVPTLAIIQVGNRADSTAFISAKKSFGDKVGVKTIHIHLDENISENDLLAEIGKLNTDDSINGIIVQLPIPEHLNRNNILNNIAPQKDVDALSARSVENWSRSKIVNTSEAESNVVFPATARGVKELLDFYQISLKDKKVTVIGRSDLVGKPVAKICEQNGAIVTVCHSKTEDIASKTKNADIVIVAVGKAKYFGREYFQQGQIVIDIGINTLSGDKMEEEVSGKKLVGDVDFDEVKDVVEAITPVPGGVGPMTVLALFENVVDLCNVRKD